ncbi:MAG: hypothetical protein H0V46_00520 [Sphingomonas sp.]|nr:hypothetical protein [Sphingomonas sp.]
MSWLAEIIQNELTFAVRDWISKKMGWTKRPKRQPTPEQRKRQILLGRRAKDRRNRRANRG